jgi:hypothetical protein
MPRSDSWDFRSKSGGNGVFRGRRQTAWMLFCPNHRCQAGFDDLTGLSKRESPAGRRALQKSIQLKEDDR